MHVGASADGDICMRSGWILSSRSLYIIGDTLLLFDGLSSFLSSKSFERKRRSHYQGAGLCRLSWLIWFCDWWRFSFSFAGMFLLGNWLSSFGLVGGRGSVCAALSVSKFVVVLSGRKFGYVGILGTCNFNALRTFEWNDDTQLALPLDFCLIFTPPSSFVGDTLASISIFSSLVLLLMRVGVYLLFQRVKYGTSTLF